MGSALRIWYTGICSYMELADAFSGSCIYRLLAVALAAISDSDGERNSQRETALDTVVDQPDRKVARLRELLKWGISCLFYLPVFLLFLHW